MQVMSCTNMILALMCAVIVLSAVDADEVTHDYKQSEEIAIYANKIGPFNNPLETYAYFELPGCGPASWEHKFPSLGQALAGDELYRLNTPVKFGEDIDSSLVCKYTPTQKDADKWSNMVRQQYWYQLYADELPMWATFGRVMSVAPNSPKEPAIYTHQSFTFGINKNRIVSVNLTADSPRPIVSGEEISFSYSVTFHSSNVKFEKRFDRYLDESFFEHRIHWFSIFNSFMMVLFLSGIVLTILARTLRADFARYAADRAAQEEGKNDWVEDAGWKQLHADVFRVPQNPVMLCALIGTGWQLTILSLVVILIAIVSVVYTSPGSLLTYGVLAFAVTSYVAGYFSASQFSYYALIGPAISTQWIRCMMTTAMFFPGTVLMMGFLLNFVAIAYDSAQAIPFGGMVVMLLLWALVAVPLVIMGTVVGRHKRPASSQHASIPHVNQIPRLIPKRPWFLSKEMFITIGGLLPFGSIFIELYFIFTSFWNYKLYYVYGFMLLVFVILVIVTACVSIVCTYFSLNAEDHRWPWTSMLVGGSTGLYVFAYSVYFFMFKTKMTGFFMFAFYFTYMAMMCFAISIICGTIAFVAASAFVTRIYRTVKSD